MYPSLIKNLLRRFPLFKGLTDYELEPILEISKNNTFQQGSHIFMQDDPLTNVYFIHHGTIKIYRTDIQGKEQIINILSAGEMFPHQGFFRNDNYPAHAEVMEEALLIYIPIHLFEDFLINNPEVSIKIFRVLGDRIVDLQNRLEEKILRNTFEQIILLLIRLGKKYGKDNGYGGVHLSTNFTNKELANMIGSSRETVSRTLTQLKKKELITTGKDGNLVLQLEGLKEELF